MNFLIEYACRIDERQSFISHSLLYSVMSFCDVVDSRLASLKTDVQPSDLLS